MNYFAIIERSFVIHLSFEDFMCDIEELAIRNSLLIERTWSLNEFDESINTLEHHFVILFLSSIIIIAFEEISNSLDHIVICTQIELVSDIVLHLSVVSADGKTEEIKDGIEYHNILRMCE